MIDLDRELFPHSRGKRNPDSIDRIEDGCGKPTGLGIAHGVHRPDDCLLPDWPDGCEQSDSLSGQLDAVQNDIVVTTQYMEIKLPYDKCRGLRVWKGECRIGRVRDKLVGYSK